MTLGGERIHLLIVDFDETLVNLVDDVSLNDEAVIGLGLSDLGKYEFDRGQRGTSPVPRKTEELAMLNQISF